MKPLLIINFVVILLTIFLLITTLSYTLKPIYEISEPLNDNWTMTVEGNDVNTIVSLPTTVPDNPINNTITIERKLPDNFFMGATILFRTSQQFITVYLEDELIYNYDASELKFGKSQGSAWHFVRLPSDFPGKTLTVKYSSPYTIYSTRVNDIYLGTKASHVFSIFNKYGLNTMIGIVLVTIGIVSLVSYFMITKLSFSSIGVFFLSLFAISTGFWTICENRIVQLFFNNPFFLYMLGLICFSSIPVYLNLFIIFNYKPVAHKLFKTNAIISVILLVTSMVLQMLNIVDLIEFLPIIHSWYIVMIILVTLVYKQEVKRNPNIRLFYLALFVLFVATLIDLFVFYGLRNGVSGYFTQIGLLLSVFIIALSVGKYLLKLTNEKAMGEALSRLAFNDILTGLKNRTSFETAIAEIQNSSCNGENPLAKLSIVMCDINDLKLVNDTYGHKSGDKLIISASNVIRSTFKDYGDVFRIGGDEFAVLINNPSDFVYEDVVVKMNKIIAIYNLTEEKAPLSIACGIASFDEKIDTDINSLFTRADNQMYLDKETQKKSNKYFVKSHE